MNDISGQNNSPARSNVPEMTVSELANSVKKTLEDTFGRVRVRGELGRVKVVRSGHMYGGLKDENAVIDIVCWRSKVSKLAVKNPEEGMEVIVTGRMSSYPARSNYQLIIESMELAGEGALLKLLEERRKKLLAEGLFDEGRKKPLPFLPDVIGVVTSDTGAVIRDIMHRLDDRFPRHVLLWPSRVQGEGAAEEIAAAIRGFDTLPETGAMPRPDVLIIGRGGGSLEDLLPFSEEIVVRAIADCTIPVISAVGHETDTSLSDYAADKRAPTPTGAAEIAVPRRIDLYNMLQDGQQRLVNLLDRRLRAYEDRVENFTARLGDPERLLEIQTQTLDHVTHKLDAIVHRALDRKESMVETLDARLISPKTVLRIKHKALEHVTLQLVNTFDRRLTKTERTLDRIYLHKPDPLVDSRERELDILIRQLPVVMKRTIKETQESLKSSARMLESLSYHSVLDRGFVVVRDKDGTVLTEAAETKTRKRVSLTFRQEKTVEADIVKTEGQTSRKKKAASHPRRQKAKKQQENSDTPEQKELF